MPNKPAHKNPKFKKELAALQSRWPGVRITAQDRATWNGYMRKINTKHRKKLKKQVAI